MVPSGGARHGARRCAAALVWAAAALGAGCRSPAPPALARLSIAVPYELDTLDPHAKNALSNFAIASHFYEALVTTDPQMKIRPSLALNWENPDPLSWVFHLRNGVRFHSGRPLRAADVVYSIRRLLAAGARLEMAGYVYAVDAVTALDPLTVRIVTRRPLTVLLNKLRFVAIVPEGSGDEALATQPDGTGPFRLARWTRGLRIEMVRHDGYWGAPPAIHDVEFLLAHDPEQASAELLAGRAQLAQCNSKLAVGALARAPHIRVVRRPSLFLKYLGYDMSRGHTPYVETPGNPFLDRRVREAIHIGIDRQALVERLSVEAMPANQPVPPFIFGFDPKLPPAIPDPARARRLLAEAGYPLGFRGVLHVRRILAEAGAILHEQLARIGVELEPRVLGDNEFLARARERDLSLYVSRFGAPTGDASDVLDTALHSIDPGRHMGLGNYGGYSNPEMDAAIEASAGIEALDRRRAALESIMARAMDDLAWVPLYYDHDVYGIDRALRWEPRSDGFVLATEVQPAGPRPPYGR